ncbi:phage head closure protein [Bacillus cereus group sp. TH153LC]|uniref:phage head closure protein n=1 Tax=Bacillus cereus group sp. TH153LC TaxID=3018059 RepID=UPI0022E373C8|nr:phage head closure protein [Bacillus cereus group sp. TH153LC]MDA1660387.1 phage head closure protein [Bacillus cereus group sp. TH153LC]
MINPGELKNRLIIQKVVTGEDENGFPIEIIEDIYKLRCKYKTVSTREYIGANREITALTYKFICRKRKIDSDMYVVFKGRQFDIKNVQEFEDDMFVEITATVRE